MKVWNLPFQCSPYLIMVDDARVVELVDTQDLKSCDHCDRAGSTPAPGTLWIKGLLEIAVPFFVCWSVTAECAF